MKHQKPATIVASLSTISSAIIITSNTHATGVTDQINVTISVACSLTSIVDTAHALRKTRVLAPRKDTV